MDGPIASAVVLPEELSVPASPVNGQKRRQESISEDAAKRPRLSQDAAASDRRNSVNDKKPAPVRREKGRERRLFGAVLGALSQNSATTVQKRRTEIEKRQQAQRKHEDHEDEQRKTERAAKRKEQRWKEQKHFERESVRITIFRIRATKMLTVHRCGPDTRTYSMWHASSRPRPNLTWYVHTHYASSVSVKANICLVLQALGDQPGRRRSHTRPDRRRRGHDQTRGRGIRGSPTAGQPAEAAYLRGGWA
jgi:hypothetical protein